VFVFLFVWGGGGGGKMVLGHLKYVTFYEGIPRISVGYRSNTSGLSCSLASTAPPPTALIIAAEHLIR